MKTVGANCAVQQPRALLCARCEVMTTLECACGTVKLEFPEDPAFSAYCHCTECRRTTAAPFFWGIGYPLDAVKGVDDDMCVSNCLVPEKKTTRHSCKACGTFLYEKPASQPILIVPGAIMSEAPQPQMHICVENKIVMLPQDGLPRFAGMPGDGVEPMPEDTV